MLTKLYELLFGHKWKIIDTRTDAIRIQKRLWVKGILYTTQCEHCSKMKDFFFVKEQIK